MPVHATLNTTTGKLDLAVMPDGIGPGLSVEEVQDIIGAMVVAAGGTYNDVAGTITLPSAGAGASVDEILANQAIL